LTRKKESVVPNHTPDPSLTRPGAEGDHTAPARERLAHWLDIAAQISEHVNAILEPDALLESVLVQLTERFELYYAHVYLLDEENRTLTLAAGYGDVGAALVRKGHAIPLSATPSLVAEAARTRAPVVVNDVRASQEFLPNPLLPLTRSELALPMMVGGKVLGVFDIQDRRPSTFTPELVDVLGTLGRQVAVALQNARSFQSLQNYLQATQRQLTVSERLAEAHTEREVAQAIAELAWTGADAVCVLAQDSTPPIAMILGYASRGLEASEAQWNTTLEADVEAWLDPLLNGATRTLSLLKADTRMPTALRQVVEATGATWCAMRLLGKQDQRVYILSLLFNSPKRVPPDTDLLLDVLTRYGGPALEQARIRDRLSLIQFSLDHVPLALLWVRHDGTLAAFNQQACALLGYSRTEMASLPSIAAIDPNMIPEAWRAHWKRIQRRKRLVMETEFRTKFGALLPIEATSNYLEYGGEAFNCIFARDIGERRQAEAARERFTNRLRTAAEIAEQVGAILEPDTLLQTVLPLLKERFGLYHAHVYTLEEDDLVLKAGCGHVGRLMVQQGHRIPYGHPHSLVARAARTREPVVANDVTAIEDFLPNTLLPRTRSEVAIPIAVGDQLLGVLDVQSDKTGFFEPSEVDALRTLAGQLANALYSATLLQRHTATERELRHSMEMVRAVFNGMTEGILLTDLLGHVTDANQTAADLYGFESQETLIGHSIMELMTHSAWPDVSQAMRLALRTGTGQVGVYRMLRRDGSTFDAEQSVTILKGPQGAAQGMLFIIRDITEREQSRQEIARFKALADNALDAIFMADFSGQLIYINHAAAQLFGYEDSLGEADSIALPALWPERSASQWLNEILPSAGSGGWQGEARLRRSDGSLFDAALTCFSVTDAQGVSLCLAMIVRDITALKRVQEELQQAALRLQTASEVSAHVTTILDPTELLEGVVPLIQERFGVYHLHVYTLDPEGKRLIMRVGSGEAGRIMRERGHTIDLDQEPSLVAKAARTRRVVRVDDVQQEPSWLPNALLPDTRSELAIPMVVGDDIVGVLDVQDRVVGRFTKGEIDTFMTLATQIAIAFRNAEYVAELKAVTERLREVDKLKSEFLANMSHELRTPLNSILGYAEVMLMGIDGELTSDMKEDVEAIFENGQQLLRLINDILDLTKIEAGHMTLKVQSVTLTPILDQVRSQAQGLLLKKPKPVELLFTMPEDLPPVLADPVRLLQILNNLVSNAVKFTEQGHVLVRTTHEPSSKEVCIAVEDTGIGIAPEDLPHLFERFRQLDGSRTRRAEGTGLGLAITKHLVEMHGGSLSVTSELGHGSTFTVCLPVAEDSGSPQSEVV